LQDRGQGLNNAIHDAATLGQELKKSGVASQSDVSSAIAAYEEEMCARGKEAVLSSNQNSLSTHNWSTLLQSPLFTAGLKQKVVPGDSKSDE
jgi:2-polyprenyl-6-methoxyphenol hydroxylase-like FAD-dependent oxidoreductase